MLYWSINSEPIIDYYPHVLHILLSLRTDFHQPGTYSTFCHVFFLFYLDFLPFILWNLSSYVFTDIPSCALFSSSSISFPANTFIPPQYSDIFRCLGSSSVFWSIVALLLSCLFAILLWPLRSVSISLRVICFFSFLPYPFPFFVSAICLGCWKPIEWPSWSLKHLWGFSCIRNCAPGLVKRIIHNGNWCELDSSSFFPSSSLTKPMNQNKKLNNRYTITSTWVLREILSIFVVLVECFSVRNLLQISGFKNSRLPNLYRTNWTLEINWT